MNIDYFPNFMPIKKSMKDDILSITKNYPCYHDFSIGNLYCWDTDNSLEITILNDNLVVKFPDYLDDNNHYYSFLGDNKVNETAEKLISLSRDKLNINFLRYVPEISISNLNNNFIVEPVRDDFDYIFETKKYINFDGHILSKLKSEYGHFLKNNRNTTKLVTKQTLDNKDWQDINIVFEIWLSTKDKPEEYDQERLAIAKMSQLDDNFLQKWVMLLYIKDKPVGFIIYELLNDWAVCHFAKADMSYSHIFNFLFIESFRQINKVGVKFINLEPDLGIEGLRISKERKQPTGFLNKYKVSLKKSGN